MDKIVLRGGSGGWDPAKNCWQFVDIYWEAGFPLDLEWLDDDCYISRVEYTLWRQVSCMDRNKAGELVVRERSRESMQSFILAERWCKETRNDAWNERADTEHPYSEDWDVEGEYWKTRD